MRVSIVAVALLLASVPRQAAADPGAEDAFSPAACDVGPAAHDPWQVLFLQPADVTAAPRLDLAAPALALGEAVQSPAPRVAVVEYSHAYEVRRKIHKYASFAMVPLFVTEFALGQSLYNNAVQPGGRRTAHALVGAGIGGLFGLNTVTGAWNLWEGRKDTHGRTVRFAHGLLMMAADAGFFATAMNGPHTPRTLEQLLNYDSNKSTHRTVALTSIGLATAGYLVMLIGGR